MPRFRYKARALDGRSIDAVADANTEEVLEKDLGRQGLTVISVQAADRRSRATSTATRLSPSDLIFLTMEIGTSYRAGLPLLSTLEDMALAAESRAIREIARGVSERVRSGSSLADALAAYPKAFPTLYIELVGAAEKTGKLDEVLTDLVRFLEWQKETKGQIVSATVYPASMLGAVVMLTLVLTLFVFPRFLATFKAMGSDLPLPTRILLGIDQGFRAHTALFGAVAVIVPVGLVLATRIPQARWWLDLAKLRMPVIGPLLTKVLMSRFAHNLAMMLASGLDFSAGLRLCERLMENAVLMNLVSEARVAVEQGKPLSDAMSRGNYVPSLVRRMLKLGETTGEMEKSLESVSQYYDKEIPRAIKRMFSILEPAMLVLMAGVVLFMASAVMLPLYTMINKVGQQ